MNYGQYDAQEWCRKYGYDWEELLPYLRRAKKEGPWIAGGAIRRVMQGKTPDTDIDYFFKNERQFEDFRAKMGEPAHTNDHVSTWYLKQGKVQAITIKYYPSAEMVLDSFDFTICQFAFDGFDFITGPHALWDLANKKLIPHKISYAASSMRRAIKYAGQGFYLCPGAATEIYRQVMDNPEAVDLTLEYVD